MYAAGMAGIPYSFTAHANDIFVRPVALREKVARSAFCACISHFNTRYLTGKGCDPAKLVVVRCGLDSAEYAYTPPAASTGPVRIFSVGRLIEKKGFVPLLGALARVRDAGIAFQCQIVGDGPLMDTLKRRIADLQLDGQVELLGSQPQERVKALLSCATVFALPCIVAQDGDQDGIPVALMEAMALGVPVVSCPVSGVPELIQDGREGLLAPPHDETRLAEALGRLASDTDLRSRLAEAARARIEREFDSHQSAGQLLGLFTKST